MPQPLSGLLVEIEIAAHNDFGRILLFRSTPAVRPVNRACLFDRVATLLNRPDQEAVDALSHDFGKRSARTGDHRRAARQRLCEDNTERFVPLDRYHHGARLPQEIALLAIIDRTNIVDAIPADPGRDLLV